jgi:hypothetical protein
VKPKKTKTKVTYTQDNIGILLLKEAYERDLGLFRDLLSKQPGFFDKPLIPRGTTFTVVTQEDGIKELFVNVPASEKK